MIGAVAPPAGLQALAGSPKASCIAQGLDLNTHTPGSSRKSFFPGRSDWGLSARVGLQRSCEVSWTLVLAPLPDSRCPSTGHLRPFLWRGYVRD